MAVGRFGVVPRVVLTLVATLVLTGVVTAAGGAFASDPATTTTAASTTTTTTVPSAKVLGALLLCFGDEDLAEVEISTIVSSVRLLSQVTVASDDVPQGCRREMTFCTEGRPVDIPGGASVQEVSGAARIESTGEGESQIATITIVKSVESSSDIVTHRLVVKGTVGCDPPRASSSSGPARATTTTSRPTTTASSDVPTTTRTLQTAPPGNDERPEGSPDAPDSSSGSDDQPDQSTQGTI